MSLFQGTVGDSRTAAQRLTDVLRLYGALGDRATGKPQGFSARAARYAASIGTFAELPSSRVTALYYAGLLHGIGALGNADIRNGGEVPPRALAAALRDVPAVGARRCADLPALPTGTADAVRWQSEYWDGCGSPDGLRWSGIPDDAQYLQLALLIAAAQSPDDAPSEVSEQSGRRFAPQHARTFTAWFARTGADPNDTFEPDALCADDDDAANALAAISDRIDAHAAAPGRSRRVTQLCSAVALSLRLDEAECSALALAAYAFGGGAIGEPDDEDDFDPLARLGIESRARNAVNASKLLESTPTLAAAAPVLAARAEWFDGTGKPGGRARADIPVEARVLAAAVAFEALERAPRASRADPASQLDVASGTQFDPAIVRALATLSQARA